MKNTLWIALVFGMITGLLNLALEEHPHKPIPKDILQKIEELFPNQEDRQLILKLVHEIQEDKWNVGSDQLIRSMLILSGPDKEKFQAIIDARFYGDPRDVILRAMSVPGNTNDHGMTPFY